MLIYEIQGQRYPSEPEAETKRKMLAHHPPEAEVIVWDVFTFCPGLTSWSDTEIDRLKLNELWNENT